MIAITQEHNMTYAEMTACEFVLASIDPPSVWNLYPSMEAAAAQAEDANTYNVRLEKHGAPKRNYAPMRFDDYQKAERACYLNQPAEAVTEETFNEMFECLPPKNLTGSWDKFFSFLMIEHWSGVYTSQYVRFADGRCFTKLVDSTDKSTWMKAEDFSK